MPLWLYGPTADPIYNPAACHENFLRLQQQSRSWHRILAGQVALRQSDELGVFFFAYYYFIDKVAIMKESCNSGSVCQKQDMQLQSSPVFFCQSNHYQGTCYTKAATRQVKVSWLPCYLTHSKGLEVSPTDKQDTTETKKNNNKQLLCFPL